MGLLRGVRGRNNVVAHAPEDKVDLQARRGHVLQQRLGEGAVPPAHTVICRGSCLGRIDDQRVVLRLDADEPAGRGAPLCTREREDVVSAGVQNHELQFGHAAELIQDGVEGDGLQAQIAGPRQPGIDRDQEVPTVALDAVAGEVDHAQIGSQRRLRQFQQRRPELLDAEIALQDDLVEAELAEGLGHGGRVVDRILQRPDLVVRIADDERHALRVCGTGMEPCPDTTNCKQTNNCAPHDVPFAEAARAKETQQANSCLPPSEQYPNGSLPPNPLASHSIGAPASTVAAAGRFGGPTRCGGRTAGVGLRRGLVSCPDPDLA